jgi:hypothetical protein
LHLWAWPGRWPTLMTRSFKEPRRLPCSHLPAWTTLAAPLGLHSQPAKCAVHSADHATAAAVAGQLGVRHAPEGLLAAGSPIGTPSFQTANAERYATRACHLMYELLALPLGDQDRWLVFHGSLQKRVAHLPLGCTWEHVGPAVVRAKSKAVDCAFAIMAQARTNGPPTEQLTLPMRHGGLGLAHTGPEEGDSMGTIAEAQRSYCRHSAQARADALLASLHDGTEGGKRARAHLLSCACRPASAWLDTLPLSRALELKSREFQTALRLRLGLAILPLNAPTVRTRVQCGCGATLHRTDTNHGMRCSALAAHFTLRHDILKGILRRAVHRAGIASTLDPPLRRLPGLTAGTGASAAGSAIRPEAWGDIVMAIPQGISIADISVIHLLSLNTISWAAATAGAAASHRDQQKHYRKASVGQPNPPCGGPWEPTDGSLVP